MKSIFFALGFLLLAVSPAFCEDSNALFEKYSAARDAIKEMSYGTRLDSPFRMSWVQGEGFAIKDNLSNAAYLFSPLGAYRAKLPRLDSNVAVIYNVKYPSVNEKGEKKEASGSLLDSNVRKYREFSIGLSSVPGSQDINFADDKDEKHWKELERYLANELDLIEPSLTEMSKVDSDGLRARLEDNFQAARALNSPIIDLAVERLIDRAKEAGFEIPKTTGSSSKARRVHTK